MNPTVRIACALSWLLLIAGCGAQPASSTDSARSSGVSPSTGPARPVIFIGLDGADWQLLDRLMSHGTMPNLEGLCREGTSGVLVTEQPPLSPLVWTTMLTGVGPLEHRILDFTRFNPRTGAREPITSDERAVPAVWNMAGSLGRSVAVFGLWATYPAETVSGVLVSDRLFSFQSDLQAPVDGTAFPAEANSWARDALRAVQEEVGFSELQAYLPRLTESAYREQLAAGDPFAHPVSALRRILIETRLYDRLARAALDGTAPGVPDGADLTILYIQGTDAIGHVFAPYLEPCSSGIPPEDCARYGSVPGLYFAEVDRLLGAWRDIARARGATLVLASDHGFFWGEGRPRSLPSLAVATAGRWHREEGIYVLWNAPGSGPGAPSGARPRGTVRQVCATLLALLGLPPAAGSKEATLSGVAPPGLTPVDYARGFERTPAAGGPLADELDADAAIGKLRALGYVGSAEPPRAAAPGSTRTAGSFNNEGLILMAAGRLGDARLAFESAIALDPANGSSLANLSELLAGSTQLPERERADALLLQALASGLPDASARVIARAKSRHDTDLLSSAIALAPRDADLLLHRGRYRLESRDCTGALDDFQGAASLAPRSALAATSMGLARACLGDESGALRDLRHSLELDPDQPEVRRMLSGVP